MTDLIDSVVIVTGTGSPHGGAAVRHAAARGARAVAVCSIREHAEENAEAIRAAGGDAIAFTGDVDRDDVVADLVAATLDAYGRIDALIHVRTGLDTPERGVDVDAAGWHEAIRIGVSGTFTLYRALIDVFAAQGAGAFATLTRSNPTSLAVATISGALRAFSRRVAEDYAHAGIRSNTVDLGVLDVSVAPNGDDLPAIAVTDGEGGPAVTPAQLAELLAFLVSPASQSVTGANVVADGGAPVRG